MLVIGDSIALGTGMALHVETRARVGAPSCTILHKEVPRGAYRTDTVVISAGVNDPPGHCLEAIRDRIHARRIIWILPAPVNSARAHVAAVAHKHGDATVSYVPGQDHLHPRSYHELARKVWRLAHNTVWWIAHKAWWLVHKG